MFGRLDKFILVNFNWLVKYINCILIYVYLYKDNKIILMFLIWNSLKGIRDWID